MSKLKELAYKLNAHRSIEGTSFSAEYLEDTDTIRVTCSADPDAITVIVRSAEQIITVTQLFNVEDIAPSKSTELYEILLRMSPLIPLSSVGLEDGYGILFGAMSVNTTFENIVHELETQAENYTDVLSQLDGYFTES